jgi:hypothetical protein
MNFKGPLWSGPSAVEGKVVEGSVAKEVAPLKGTTAKTYLHIAQQAGVLVNEVIPRTNDEEYKEARLLAVTYLRMAAAKLRQVAEARALVEKG